MKKLAESGMAVATHRKPNTGLKQTGETITIDDGMGSRRTENPTRD